MRQSLSEAPLYLAPNPLPYDLPNGKLIILKKEMTHSQGLQISRTLPFRSNTETTKNVTIEGEGPDIPL